MATPHFASTDHSPSLATPSRTPPSQSYSQLVSRGFTPGEAGTLAAYLEGLDMAHHTWTLREVNGLLFLRHLHRRSRFGESDGERTEQVDAGKPVEAPGSGR
jgi:hypothetical protein